MMNDNPPEKSFNVFYDESIAAVVMEWRGYFTSDEFKFGTSKMLETLKNYSAQKVLADVKEMVLISVEDQRWMETFFLPEAIAAGFKRCAIVQPVHYFNKVAIENITFKIDQQQLLVNLFDDMDNAREWLLKS